MNNINPFFKRNNKVYLKDVLKILNIKKVKSKNYKINDIREISKASKNDLKSVRGISESLARIIYDHFRETS